MIVRPLSVLDDAYPALLNRLSPCPEPDRDGWRRFCERLHDDHHQVFVLETDDGGLAGAATLLIENKLIHGMGRVGHVEDVVVDERHRGQGFGRALIDHAVDHAKRHGCYKVILDCAPDKTGFYTRCGFHERGVQMALYF